MNEPNHALIDGKVVLITGATGPMGRLLVDAFLDAGARLSLCVRRMAHLPELERRLADRGAEAMIVPCDLRYEENVVRLIHRVVHQFRRIDVIVNAAFVRGPEVDLVDYPIDPWRDVLATNLTGAYLLCREALPWMVRQGSGSIIHTTSSFTTTARPEAGAYLVGNHGIEGMTRLLAEELRDTGVRVNAVDIGRMAGHRGPVGSDKGWIRAFLWLAGDESAGRTGERIRAADIE